MLTITLFSGPNSIVFLRVDMSLRDSILASKRPAGAPALCVLLAENDADTSSFVAHLLRFAGFRVELAENGAVAIAKAERFRYDLIITDLDMPEVDGVEAARRIRALDQAKGLEPVPIIALSVHATAEPRERAFTAGMAAFLSKPVASARLLETAREWADDRTSILIVDDTEDNRLVMTRMLQSRPRSRVVAVHGGEAAIAALQAQRIDIVLMDIVMPEMDGYTAARAMRALPLAQQLPILAVTAYSEASEHLRCLEAGFTDHLAKPLARDALLAAIERHLPALPAVARPAPAEHATGAAADEAFEYADLIPGFLDRRRGDLQRIREWLAASAFDQLIRLGHNLKGSGGQYGFPSISEIGALLETAARDQRREQIAELAEKLERLLAAQSA